MKRKLQFQRATFLECDATALDGKFSFFFHVFNIQARAKGSLMVCAWKKMVKQIS